MPKLVGKAFRVVGTEGLTVDELVGNASTQQDTLSVAHVRYAQPGDDPVWLNVAYDEWMSVTKGRIEVQYYNGDKLETLHVGAGETCFIGKGERAKPIFPVGDTEYIAVCLPAFSPDRCVREYGATDVNAKIEALHRKPDYSSDHLSTIYHMCQRSLWDAAVAAQTAYFPPTFEQDGYFTHASAVPERMLQTANHFYKNAPGDWICLALDNAKLKALGIVTRFEEAMPVGNTDVEADDLRFPHIYGGIPTQIEGVVSAVHPMKRGDDGTFLSIPGLVE